MTRVTAFIKEHHTALEAPYWEQRAALPDTGPVGALILDFPDLGAYTFLFFINGSVYGISLQQHQWTKTGVEVNRFVLVEGAWNGDVKKRTGDKREA